MKTMITAAVVLAMMILPGSISAAQQQMGGQMQMGGQG